MKEGTITYTRPGDPRPDGRAILPPHGSELYLAMVEANAMENLCDGSGYYYTFDDAQFKADVKALSDQYDAEVAALTPPPSGTGRY